MPSIALATESSYRKQSLKNVPLWEPCQPAEAHHWLEIDGQQDDLTARYAIRPIPLQGSIAPRLYVITEPQGGLWKEGSLYLYEKMMESTIDEQTVSNICGDLADFMNKITNGNRTLTDFNGAKFERPTYFYKAELKKEIINGKLTRETANRKIASMIGLYRWMTLTRHFRPQQSMWESFIRRVRYTDGHGIAQSKEVIVTDLTFKTTKTISIGKTISDGGELKPLPRSNQQDLLTTLINLSNTEMLLAHIVSLTSGLRSQSVFTLRQSSIIKGIGSSSDKYKFALHGVQIGGDSLVEAKKGKEQTVLLPAWVHHVLHVYISSPRYKQRAEKSPLLNGSDQYIFLTRTGRPYYIAKKDQPTFEFSNEKGSAIRQFLRKVNCITKNQPNGFTYRFHDLRATFGMNLIEDNSREIEDGRMNHIELLDLVRRRLNHESPEVTLRYLKYHRDNPQLLQAQHDFEEHLIGLVKTEMNKHEAIRTRDRPRIP